MECEEYCLQRLRIGEKAEFNGILVSYEDYEILRKRKKYLQTVKELENKLNMGLDV